MYHFTGVQHTKTENVTIPTADRETYEGALDLWHEEWRYTYANEDRTGLDVFIFDDDGNMVFSNKYVKGALKPSV